MDKKMNIPMDEQIDNSETDNSAKGKSSGRTNKKRLGFLLKGALLGILCILLIGTLFPALEGITIPHKHEDGSESWMAAISDERLVSDINIPGTHDSATRYVQIPFYSKCQSLSIRQQLDAGFRYLDIRLGIDYDDSHAPYMKLMHGFTNCRTGFWPTSAKLTLDNVLEDCYEFLDQHPTETIMFVVKKEHGQESVEDFQSLLHTYIEKNPDAWYVSDEVPTLGECRGKIILCRRYEDALELEKEGGINVTWIDQPGHEDRRLNYRYNETGKAILIVQDRYEYDQTHKWRVFKETVREAEKEKRDNQILINFASTKGTMPYGNPYYFATKLNRKIRKYDFENYKHLGWIVMDYGSPELAKKIYERN